MGRREISVGALLAVFGLGGAALVAGVTTPHTDYTALLVWGGVAAMALSGAGLARLFLAAPLASAASAAHAAAPPTPPREFLPPEIDARALRDKVKGRTSVQVRAITQTYAGKWLRHEGEVRDVDDVHGGRWLLQISTPDHGWELVAAVFEKKWHDQLAALNKGDWVVAVGQLTSLQTTVRLDHCEIEHVGRPPAPARPRASRSRAK